MRNVHGLVTKLEDIEQVVQKVREVGMYSFDFETLGLRPGWARIAGVGIAWGTEPDNAVYILCEHESHPGIPWKKVLDVLKPMFEDESLTAVAHNFIFDGTLLLMDGVKLHRNVYDTMVMSWLLNTSDQNGLKWLVRQKYGYTMSELDQFCPKERVLWHNNEPIIRVDKAPIEHLVSYGIDDVRWTLKLCIDYLPQIRADARLNKIYHELEQEFLLILAEMQAFGVRVDRDYLELLRSEVDGLLKSLIPEMITMRPGQDFDPALLSGNIDLDRKRIPELQEKWRDSSGLRPLLYKYPHLAHKAFNLSSVKQLNRVLFDELKLKPIGDKGANGLYSVDSDVLSKLRFRDKTGFVEKLMKFRELSKLYGTYLDGMQPLINSDGRLRTRFNPTLQTGRLSSSDPNLQNIPARTEFGKRVRKAFIADPGMTLVIVDYSQIELRLAAHFSGDESMINGFHRGADPHSMTAKVVFNLDADVNDIKKLYPLERSIAKTLNFAVLYQAGPRTVRDQIIKATDGEFVPTEEQAKWYIDRFFSNAPRIKEYIHRMERMAQTDGLVRTIIGRPRHLPDARNMYDPRRRAAALRQAVNSPIQGSAADIMALAMRNIRRHLVAKGYYPHRARMVLQVHDELILEVDESLAQEVAADVQRIMQNVVKLRVPLEADPKIAPNWYEGK